MKTKYLTTLITLFIVLVLVFAVYLQKYNPEIYMGVLLFILSWVIVSVIWMFSYIGIERHRNKKS